MSARRPRRPRLTYANVVATLALFLALGGGAVWAAGKITSDEIGKGAVKNKNLAKNAVKTKNIAKNAVSSAKLAKNAVTGAKVKAGAVNFDKLAAGTNVIASATAGPVAANVIGPTDLQLSNPISVTPTAGQPLMLNAEVRSTLTQAAAKECGVVVLPTVNGNPQLAGQLLFTAAPSVPPEPEAPSGLPVAGVQLPLGLTQPGQQLNITLKFGGDADCSAGSKMDQVTLVVTRVK